MIIAIIAFVANYFYRKPIQKSGEASTDFSATLINGEPFKLSQLKGSFVLLDFWGSWCGPCRRENPDLVQLYHASRDLPFEIVSIAIETNENAWRNAIAKDNLAWKYHIGQFDRFSSPLPELYQIRQIPTKLLLDKNGVIIKVNPDTDEILPLIKQAM